MKPYHFYQLLPNSKKSRFLPALFHAYTIITRILWNCDFIKYGNRTFFFARVKVVIGVPRHVDVGVAWSARNFLNIDPFVYEQGNVRMPEIVDANMRKPCSLCKLRIFVFNDGIA